MRLLQRRANRLATRKVELEREIREHRALGGDFYEREHLLLEYDALMLRLHEEGKL